MVLKLQSIAGAVYKGTFYFYAYVCWCVVGDLGNAFYIYFVSQSLSKFSVIMLMTQLTSGCLCGVMKVLNLNLL